MSDDLTSALDRIRAELRTFGASDADTALLLAAVDKVLELHRRSERPSRTSHVCTEHVRQSLNRGRDLPAWRAAVAACPDCTVTETYVCAHEACRHECPDDDAWPCPTVRAISAELTKGHGGDE